MNVGLQQVDALRMLPCLNQDALIACLKEELPVYLVASADADISEEVPRLAWCMEATDTHSNMAACRENHLCPPPSSAPAERAFSLPKASFSHLQGSVLADQVEAALMLQYNRRCSGGKDKIID